MTRLATAWAGWGLAGGLLLLGCLPSSQRETSHALLPADSASVARAATVPVDSLASVWQIEPRLDLPTGLAWLHPDAGADARLALVETQAGGVHVFAPDGRADGAWSLDERDAFPHLAGTAGDTVVVLRRGARRLDWLTATGPARRLDVPPDAASALVAGPLVLVRTGGGVTEQPPALLRLDPRTGAVVERHAIAGAPWRAVGALRPFGDRVLALSGYRPVADVWTPGAGATLDTLALDGFASPLLARSAAFGRGDARQPPLLTASAAALGDRLYVLNLRDDHTRVDVYDASGRLVRVLVARREPPGWVPADLAVREAPDAPTGTVEIAVVSARPIGLGRSAGTRLALYRWAPPASASPAR